MQLILKSSQDYTLQFSTWVHLSITRSRCGILGGIDSVAHGAKWLKVGGVSFTYFEPTLYNNVI